LWHYIRFLDVTIYSCHGAQESHVCTTFTSILSNYFLCEFFMDFIKRQVIHFAIISCRLMDSGYVYCICHPYLQISLYRSAQVLSNLRNLEFEDNLVWTSNWHRKSIGSIEHTCLVTVLSTFCTHCPTLLSGCKRENHSCNCTHCTHCSLVAREKTIALQPTMEPTGLQILESSLKQIQIQIQKLSWGLKTESALKCVLWIANNVKERDTHLTR